MPPIDRPDTVDEQTWSQLTDAEREAMVPDEDPVGEPAAETPPATDPPVNPPAPTEAPAPGETPPADAPAATEPPAAPPAVEPPAATPAPAAPAPVVDPYEPVELLLPNYATDKAKINDAVALLVKKFDDGELSTAEYVTQRDAENAKLAQLEREKMRVDNRTEERSRYFALTWNVAQQSFFTAPANAEFYKAGSEQAKEFNALVTELGTAPRFANHTHAQFLAAIDRMVRPLYPAETPAATPPAAPAPAAKGRVPDLGKVPPTLSSVPPADRANDRGGEFDHIDKLTGEAYEKAIASMTKDQRARWEAS